jgi:MFS family permease
MARSLPYAAVLGLATLCYVALGVVLPGLPPHVTGELGAGTVAVGLAIGAVSISGVVLRPVGGRLADRRGARPVVIGGALAMAGGAALALLGGGIVWLVATRLVVGAGEGAMMAACVTWLLWLAPPDRRGRAIGHIGLANYAGLAAGPLLATALPRGFTAPLAVAVAAPLAAVACALLPRAPAGTGRASATPLLARSALRPGAGLALVNVGYTAVVSFAGLALARRGLAARAVIPLYAATIIALRTLGGALPDRLGPRRALAGAAGVAGAGLALLAAAGSLPFALAGAVVAGAGQAVAVPALGLLALHGVAESERGAASGTFFAFFDVGVGAGGPLLGAVAAVAGAGGAIAAGAACSAAACSALLPARRAS